VRGRLAFVIYQLLSWMEQAQRQILEYFDTNHLWEKEENDNYLSKVLYYNKKENDFLTIKFWQLSLTTLGGIF